MVDHYNFSDAKNMPVRSQYVSVKMADDLFFASFHCGRLSAVVVAIHPILGTLPAQSTKIHPSFNKILTNLNRGQTFGICTEMKSLYNQIMYDQLNKIFCSLYFYSDRETVALGSNTLRTVSNVDRMLLWPYFERNLQHNKETSLK